MKHTVLVLVLLSSLLPLGAQRRFDSRDLNGLRIVNQSNFEIHGVYISPAQSQYWGPELLGERGILERGQSSSFFVHYPGGCENFDVLIVDQNRRSTTYRSHRICDGQPVEIVVEPGDLPDRAPPFELGTIEIENGTVPLVHLFILSEGTQTFGVDYLGEELLDVLDTRRFYVPVSNRVATYRIVAVDADMDFYTEVTRIDRRNFSQRVVIDFEDLRL